MAKRNIKKPMVKANPFADRIYRPMNQHIREKEKIIAECGISVSTFHRWIDHPEQIPKLARQTIAKILGCTVKELFPDTLPNLFDHEQKGDAA